MGMNGTSRKLREKPISELARQVRDLMGVEMTVNHKPEREGDIRHSQADIQKLKNTGFQFQYSFDEGLARLAGYLMGSE